MGFVRWIPEFNSFPAAYGDRFCSRCDVRSSISCVRCFSDTGGPRTGQSLVLALVMTAILALGAILWPTPGKGQSPAPLSPATARRDSGEAQWIWTADQTPGRVPAGTAYFRRVFMLENPEAGQVAIACDDAYELHVNGRRVAAARDWQTMARYDIKRYLVAGRNTLAVKAENLEPGAAGLVARVTVRSVGGTDVSYSTDARWKVSRREYPNWQAGIFNDTAWAAARSLGEFGRTPPWAARVRSEGGAAAGRFKIDTAFHVERVVGPEKSGSVIAMAFNEWGDILLSQEQGPVLVLSDRNQDGAAETMNTYCDQVKNCQGLLALNGQVYATGDGPEGAALYRLSDENGDRQAEKVETLFKFTKPISEHGAHALTLGPDGMIYLMLGNHAEPSRPYAASSPYHHFYEGDLVQPRYEDPAGHSAGVKAPAGMIVRTDPDGGSVELVAGGLRNAYDLAFNEQGDLFTADSDMESDESLPWYRPTRINHVVPGAEFGWRSGWAVWPDYFLDSLPAVLDTGRGSPSGVEFYHHNRYPESLRKAMFVADWSRGRILVVRMKPAGGSYQASSEVFLEGQPLNATDLAVGPDGWLYFCTGGRGTEGGIYRIVYNGKQPPQPRLAGMLKALRQPQLHSAWSREDLAIIKQELGSQWERQLAGVAINPAAPLEDRLRALDLMQLLGPYPAKSLLIKLSSGTADQLRAKAAYFMGLHSDESTRLRLVELLDDPHPTVRRTACEALVRAEQHAPSDALLQLLADPHRHVAYAARLALEALPADQWRDALFAHPHPAVFAHGSVALLALHKDRATVDAVLQRGSQMMNGYVSDDDFLSLLRVLQLALHRGEVKAAEVPELCKQLADEYPALEPRINRELLRLLAYLEEPGIADRLMGELQGKAATPEKMQIAMHARFFKSGWTTAHKFALLEFCEQARVSQAGTGLARYMEVAQRDFCSNLTAAEETQLLADAVRLPGAALQSLLKLPVKPGAEALRVLEDLDARLAPIETEAAQQFRVGIMAILARSREPQAFEFLRGLYERDPNRRAAIAMGLAQEPAGENWPLLVNSLNILEGAAAEEVLTRLAEVDRQPQEPEAFRQAILCGLKLGEKSKPAVTLLEKWSGDTRSKPDDTWEVALGAWQAWFTEMYPNLPEPKLPVASAESKWSLEELTNYLNSPEGKQGRSAQGELVFERAQCIKCHRYGTRGESVGPDLTTIGRRFHTREILESVLYPSHVVSDQYASKAVETKDGRTLAGLVVTAGTNAIVVLQINGQKSVVAKSNIEQISPLGKSAMPEGLFNTLSLEEIADLLAYLTSKEPAVVSKSPIERK